LSAEQLDDEGELAPLAVREVIESGFHPARKLVIRSEKNKRFSLPSRQPGALPHTDFFVW